MLLCPQREYRSEEAGQTCNTGLDPVADRDRFLIPQFWAVCTTLTDIQYDAMYKAKAFCVSSSF